MCKSIYCLECQAPIPPEKPRNKFCGHSCSAKYSNTRRAIPKKPLNECLSCGSPVKGKYCDTQCQQDHRWKLTKDRIENGHQDSNKVMRRYLLDVKGHCCNKCGRSEWNGQPIPIEMEHIDGNSDNNSLNNLELLCPNCHAQTPTYKSRNKGNGRAFRRQRYADGKSY